MQVTELTTQWLLKMFFYGVAIKEVDPVTHLEVWKLASPSGEAFPEENLQFNITAAMRYFENQLSICIIPPESPLKETHDYNPIDFRQGFCYLRLMKRPIIAVNSLALKYGNTRIVQIPADWIQFSKDNGVVQTVPSGTSMGSIAFLGSGLNIPGNWALPNALPQAWEVEYTYGMDGISEDLAKLIGKKAVVDAFVEYGESLFPPAIDQYSIGLDGISQSVSSSKSQGLPFNGRVEAYRKEIESALAIDPPGYLRTKYEGPQLTVL